MSIPIATRHWFSLALAIVFWVTPALAQADASVATRDDPDLGTVLTDPDGMTLYTFDRDTPGSGSSACSGQCATIWPPLTTSDAAVAPEDLAGTLDVITRDDGSHQITYNGLPLYRYANDTQPGDAKGQNVAGVWHVATVPQ